MLPPLGMWTFYVYLTSALHVESKLANLLMGWGVCMVSHSERTRKLLTLVSS